MAVGGVLSWLLIRNPRPDETAAAQAKAQEPDSTASA
jgi:hypothetical protein